MKKLFKLFLCMLMLISFTKIVWAIGNEKGVNVGASDVAYNFVNNNYMQALLIQYRKVNPDASINATIDEDKHEMNIYKDEALILTYSYTDQMIALYGEEPQTIDDVDAQLHVNQVLYSFNMIYAVLDSFGYSNKAVSITDEDNQVALDENFYNEYGVLLSQGMYDFGEYSKGTYLIEFRISLDSEKIAALVSEYGVNRPDYVAIANGETPQEPDVCTVTFNSNGGSLVESIEVNCGSPINRPDDPTKDNAIFNGWLMSDGVTYFDFDNMEVNEDITLTANWIDIKDVTRVQIEGIVEPKDGEHPDTSNIEIVSEGLHATNAYWIKESNEHEMTSSDTFVGKERYILRIVFEKEEYYNLIDAPELSPNIEPLMGEFLKDSEEIRLNYEAKSVVVPKISKAPVIKVKNANNNTLSVTWGEVENATSYVVYLSSDNKKFTKDGTTSELSYTIKDLTYGKKYYVKVKAQNSTSSKTSEVVSGKTVPNKVTNLSVVSVGTNNIKISWDKVSVSGYEIYSSTDNKTFKKIKTITDKNTIEFNNKELKANKTYYYKVRAYKTVSGSKVYGGYSEVVSKKTAPAKPEFTIGIKNYNALSLKVGEVKGAVKYVIQKEVDGTYTLLEEITEAKSVVDSDLEVGKTYKYRVRACNKNNNCSGWVEASKKQTAKTPSFTLTTPKTKKVLVTLKSVNGVDGYEIYRSTSKNGTYKLVKTILTEENVLEYTNGTKSRVTYYYKVRAYTLLENGKKVYTSYSKVQSIRSK